MIDLKQNDEFNSGEKPLLSWFSKTLKVYLEWERSHQSFLKNSQLKIDFPTYYFDSFVCKK